MQSDGERLRTALVNLLTNARHAVRAQAQDTPGAVDRIAPNGQPVIVTTSRLGPHRVAIVVSDRGVGIAPEDLPRIFDPYFTTRRTGSGLGLPIAKNIIEGLGGSIAVVSRPGAGTDVRIELGDAPVQTGRT